MEREAFFSGYCRQMDNSRMVAAVAEGETLLEADCAYPDCPNASDCTVAQKISAFVKQE